MIYILQGKILLNKTYLKYSSRRIFLTLLYENKNIKIKTVHYSIHKGTSTWYVYLFEYNNFLNDLIALSIISTWWYNYQQIKKCKQTAVKGTSIYIVWQYDNVLLT